MSDVVSMSSEPLGIEKLETLDIKEGQALVCQIDRATMDNLRPESLAMLSTYLTDTLVRMGKNTHLIPIMIVARDMDISVWEPVQQNNLETVDGDE